MKINCWVWSYEMPILLYKILQGYSSMYHKLMITKFSHRLGFPWCYYAPHTTKLWAGYIGFTPSVKPSVRPSVRPASRVRSVTSTVQDGFFPYLVQMINSMRGCVACYDPWPWLISSRSFGLGLKNRVCCVASTVLDGFFPYLVQMITSMRRCVACDDLWPWPISSRSFDLDFENCVHSVTFSVLDRLFSIQFGPIIRI